MLVVNVVNLNQDTCPFLSRTPVRCLNGHLCKDTPVSNKKGGRRERTSGWEKTSPPTLEGKR